jgi:acetoin utilization deacetylase AcuC-like enzyme
MKIVYSDKHAQHDPQTFFVRGVKQRSSEQPERAERLLAAAKGAGHEIMSPKAHGSAPAETVHTPEYIDFLKTIARDWAKLPNASAEVVPNVHPARYPATYPKALAGRAGWHQVDLACPIGPHTWDAALAASESATTAADLVLGGAREAYALCRPPGHHAYADMAGGFCFLNNTAITAQRLRQKHQRVAVLDVDVHHGNGTQGIFFERDDVLTVSIHADPDNYYPYFWGHAHETGVGKGHGFNLNLPLPLGSADAPWLAAGDKALSADPRLRADRAGRRPGPRRQRKRSAAGPQGDRCGLPRHGREDRRPRPADCAGAGRRLSQRRPGPKPRAVPGGLRKRPLMTGARASGPLMIMSGPEVRAPSMTSLSSQRVA